MYPQQTMLSLVRGGEGSHVAARTWFDDVVPCWQLRACGMNHGKSRSKACGRVTHGKKARSTKIL